MFSSSHHENTILQCNTAGAAATISTENSVFGEPVTSPSTPDMQSEMLFLAN